MKCIGLALLLAVMPAVAQVAQNPEERIQKIVQLKYADANSLQMLLMNFGVEMRSDSRMKVLTLAGPRNRVTTAEDAIKQLDTPAAAQKDIELTVYFVMGSDTTTTSGAAVPQDLQSTVAALKTTFPYKTYVLLDTLSLRARSGVGADTTGQLSANRFSSFKVGSASVEGDGTMIRLDRLHAGLRIPHTTAIGTGPGGVGAGIERKTEYIDTGITTEIVDVKEGQKLVVGRSSLDGPNTALFLVLIAKVVN